MTNRRGNQSVHKVLVRLMGVLAGFMASLHTSHKSRTALVFFSAHLCLKEPTFGPKRKDCRVCALIKLLRIKCQRGEISGFHYDAWM